LNATRKDKNPSKIGETGFAPYKVDYQIFILEIFGITALGSGFYFGRSFQEA